MKMKLLFLVCFSVFVFASYAQWNTTGDNSTTGNLYVGSTVSDSYSKLVINGPNAPINSGSKRDISFEFAAAGSAAIRSYRGGTWDTYLQFLTSSSGNVGGVPAARLHINGDGKVGVGTVNPIAYLHTRSAGDELTTKFEQASTSNGNTTPVVLIEQANPTNSSALKINFTGTGGDSYTYNNTAALEITNASNHRAFTINNASGVRLFEVNKEGNVGIGTPNPDARLAVKGTVHANEVKVDLNGAIAPDYVFEPTYTLPSLDAVQSFINQNKHLPEVPSAKEMETNGVNLGEMNMLLLKKVEELTLYVIELKKELNQLKDNKK